MTTADTRSVRRHRLNIVLGALFVLWGGALIIRGLLHTEIELFGVLLVGVGVWTLVTRLRTTT